MGFPSKQQVLEAAKDLSFKDDGLYVRTNGLWHVLMFLRHRACHGANTHYTFESYDLAQAAFDLNGVALPILEDSRDVYFEPGATQGNEIQKLFRHREGPRQTYLNRIYSGLVGSGPRQPKLFDASSNALPTTVNLVADWIKVLRSLSDNKLVLDIRIQSLMTWLFRFGVPTLSGHTAHLSEHIGNGRLNAAAGVIQSPIPESNEEFQAELAKFFGLTTRELYSLFPEVNRVNTAVWAEDSVISPTSLDAELLSFLNGVQPVGNAETDDLSELAGTFIAAAAHDAKLRVELSALTRLAGSLLSKRFLVLSGLAGSGKTKIAQAFARWITVPDGCCEVVPVGADWTGNDNLVGYPNGLEIERYHSKPALKLMMHAEKHAELPHFLILDEMNLSHVERYFADILSAMESEAAIPLHQDGKRMANGQEVPNAIVLPPNLFIIGTVNVDETTYMFSPKVLDRANVIEFRMEAKEIEAYLDAPKAVKLAGLNGEGLAKFGKSFVEAAADKSRAVPEAVKGKFKEEMLLFFVLLQQHHAEFGYRTSYEAGRFIHFFKELGGDKDEHGNPIPDEKWFAAAMDAVIVQKLLPKLHGSRTKLEGLLWALGYACGADWGNMAAFEFQVACLEAGEAQNEGKYSPEAVHKALKGKDARYPLSFDKILRMHRKLVRDQFVTFAEA